MKRAKIHPHTVNLFTICGFFLLFLHKLQLFEGFYLFKTWKGRNCSSFCDAEACHCVGKGQVCFQFFFRKIKGLAPSCETVQKSAVKAVTGSRLCLWAVDYFSAAKAKKSP